MRFTKQKYKMKKYFLILLILPIITASRAQDSVSLFSLVSSHENVPLEGNRIISIPTLGPYLIAGNKLYALNDKCDMKSLSFPEDILIDDMIWNGDDFIIKSLNHVYAFKSIYSPRLEFETDNFKIFPCEEGKIYVVSQHEGMSHLYMANLKLKKVQRMVNLHGDVLNVAKRGSVTWVTTNECVYRFEDERCEIMLQFQEPVNSVVMADFGLLFASDNTINLFTDRNNYVTLFEGENHGISYDGEWLYIITEQYDLVRCHSVFINTLLMLMDAISEE